MMLHGDTYYQMLDFWHWLLGFRVVLALANFVTAELVWLPAMLLIGGVLLSLAIRLLSPVPAQQADAENEAPAPVPAKRTAMAKERVAAAAEPKHGNLAEANAAAATIAMDDSWAED